MNETFEDVLSYAETKMSEGDYLVVADTLRKAILERKATVGIKPIDWKKVDVNLSVKLASEKTCMLFIYKKIFKGTHQRLCDIHFYALIEIHIDGSLVKTIKGNVMEALGPYIRLLNPTGCIMEYNGISVETDSAEVLKTYTLNSKNEKKCRAIYVSNEEDEEDEEDNNGYYPETNDVFKSHIYECIKNILLSDTCMNYDDKEYLSYGPLPC